MCLFPPKPAYLTLGWLRLFDAKITERREVYLDYCVKNLDYCFRLGPGVLFEACIASINKRT